MRWRHLGAQVAHLESAMPLGLFLEGPRCAIDVTHERTSYQISEEGANFAFRFGVKGKVWEAIGITRILIGFY